MKKALLIYDRSTRFDESGDRLRDVLVDIYDGMYSMDSATQYDALTYRRLSQYHTVILAAANWDCGASRQSVAALIRYVACGGSLLAIADALGAARYFEMNALFGAKQLGAGTPCLLDLSCTGRHGITEYVEPFSVTEYPCFYELDPIMNPNVLLELNYAGKQYPAAWHHSYAWGKVFCITVGNLPESYLPMLRKIFWRTGEWFLNRL